MTNRSNLIQDILRTETTATEYKKYIVFCGKNPTEEKIRKMMGFTLTEMQRWNSTKSDPIELINDIIAERKSKLQYYNDITENITKRMGAISNEAAKAALIAIALPMVCDSYSLDGEKDMPASATATIAGRAAIAATATYAHGITPPAARAFERQ